MVVGEYRTLLERFGPMVHIRRSTPSFILFRQRSLRGGAAASKIPFLPYRLAFRC